MKKQPNFDFIGNKKIFFTISLVLIVFIGILAACGRTLVDIQFSGGTIVNYAYTGEINAKEVEAIAEKSTGSQVTVSMKSGINGKDSFDVTLTEKSGLAAEKQSEMLKAMKDRFGDQIELMANSSVDPVIGNEFFLKSMVAVAFGSLILIIYIGFRFKKMSGWSAGCMAVLALIHDVIIVFGVFLVFKMPIDYNFIAVILTILGYSINDTIVIYDRIRENKTSSIGKNLTTGELVNLSINQSLTRTIHTSVTTMISMVVISIVALVSGVTSILSFSFPLLIGLVSGCYSTIFIAGPLWVLWQDHKAKAKAKKEHTAVAAK